MNRLNEIEARANAATEGPWEAKSETPTMAGAVWNLRITGKPGIRMNVTEWQHGMENAEFIAHARTDVPALVAALRAVLDLHIPDYTYPDCPKCAECSDLASTEARRVAVTWPCPTVAEIHQHLGDDK